MTDYRCPMVLARRACSRRVMLRETAAVRRTAVFAELRVKGSASEPRRRRSLAGLMAAAGVLLAACSGNSSYFSSTPFSSTPAPAATPAAPATTLGTGQVKVALILPLSAAGNAGIAGQAMRNAAEMALAEFNT